jgi:hypothetical protein
MPQKMLADKFFMYVEDMQWCMDFKRLGLSIVFLPEAHVVHLMGSSGGAKNEMINQNMQTFMNLYFPKWKRKLISVLNSLLTKSHGS